MRLECESGLVRSIITYLQGLSGGAQAVGRRAGGGYFLRPRGYPPGRGGYPPSPPGGGGPDVRHFLASKGDPRHSKCPSGAEKRAFDIGGQKYPPPARRPTA